MVRDSIEMIYHGVPHASIPPCSFDAKSSNRNSLIVHQMYGGRLEACGPRRHGLRLKALDAEICRLKPQAPNLLLEPSLTFSDSKVSLEMQEL